MSQTTMQTIYFQQYQQQIAPESTPSGAEGGNYNDNTDNMYARQQCEREGKRIKIIHRKALSPCRDVESGNRMVSEW